MKVGKVICNDPEESVLQIQSENFKFFLILKSSLIWVGIVQYLTKEYSANYKMCLIYLQVSI